MKLKYKEKKQINIISSVSEVIEVWLAGTHTVS
jgi:hypothetical protein